MSRSIQSLENNPIHDHLGISFTEALHLATIHQLGDIFIPQPAGHLKIKGIIATAASKLEAEGR